MVEITTVEQFDRFWYGETDEITADDDDDRQHHDTQKNRDYVSLLRRLSIKGDTQIIGSKDHPDVIHPVVQLLHERKRKRQLQRNDDDDDDETSATTSKTTQLNDDGKKVALVVEGGGMRGCVSAGMICALDYLGLQDSVDVVYGSSAGAVVSSYFIAQQLPFYGPEVYYDQLTSAGDKFIDLKRLLRSLGFGLADPRLVKDVLTRPNNGKPLLNLHYLVGTTMQEAKPLDWKKFQARQKVQPLKIVATGLKSERPVVLSQESGHFDSLEDLCSSLHASCLLPGIAGPVMNVLKNPKSSMPKFVLQNGYHKKNDDGDEYEPLADAMLSAPIPFQIALDDGATHVVVLRSSKDGTNLMDGTAAKSIWENLIFRRFFLRKNHFPGMFKRIQHEQEHQRIYAKSILELNERAAVADAKSGEKDYVVTVALGPETKEVSHLETSREAIFEGVRSGFARAYDALVEDPSLRGQGYKVAKEYFPDEIMDYDPEEIVSLLQQQPNQNDELKSAFETYLSLQTKSGQNKMKKGEHIFTNNNV